MEESTNPNKRVSDNSSSEKATKEISIPTSVNSSTKATSNEKSLFPNFFQKLTCSSSNHADDKSEVIVISKSGPK